MKKDLGCFFRHLIAPVLLSFSGVAVATDVADLKQEVRNQYQPIIQQINQLLVKHQSMYLQDPASFGNFIDDYVRVHWDASSTSSALIGREAFQALETVQRERLVAAVDRTLVRYAFEGFEYYDGHQFTLVAVAISKSRQLGWLQILMESPIIPDLNLEILIKRKQKGLWKAVDVRFKGITYVAVKKHEFRKTLKKQGIQALNNNLVAKNNNFFSELCDPEPQEDRQSCQVAKKYSQSSL